MRIDGAAHTQRAVELVHIIHVGSRLSSTFLESYTQSLGGHHMSESHTTSIMQDQLK